MEDEDEEEEEGVEEEEEEVKEAVKLEFTISIWNVSAVGDIGVFVCLYFFSAFGSTPSSCTRFDIVIFVFGSKV